MSFVVKSMEKCMKMMNIKYRINTKYRSPLGGRRLLLERAHGNLQIIYSSLYLNQGSVSISVCYIYFFLDLFSLHFCRSEIFQT